MSNIVILDGNQAQINIDVQLEANDFKKRRMLSSLSTLQLDDVENDKLIRLVIDQILFLKQSEAIVSLEEYRNLIGRLIQLRNNKKFFIQKTKELIKAVNEINKINDVLKRNRALLATKILEFPIK